MGASSVDSKIIKTIDDAFWSLYEMHDVQSITLSDVSQVSGIPVESIRTYYKSAAEILRAIENRQLDMLEGLFDEYERGSERFVALFTRFQKHYDKNERYLGPLVIEYRDYKFAMHYRNVVEDRLFKDLDIMMVRKDRHALEVVELVLASLVNLFLNAIALRTVNEEDVMPLSEAIMRRGFEPVLRDTYGVLMGVMSSIEND